MRAHDTGREGGYTLIEVVIVMAIFGMLTATVAAAIVVGLRTFSPTATQVEEAARSHIASAPFLTDVQSAATVSTSSGCAPSGLLVQFSWTDIDDSTTSVAWYETDEPADPALVRLHRVLCGQSPGEPLAVGLDDVTFECLDRDDNQTTCDVARKVRLTLTQPDGHEYEIAVTRRTSP